jgi:hypothetical protein
MSDERSGMTPTEYRKRVRDNGHHPVPLNFKNPNVRKKWQEGFNPTDAEIELWAELWPKAVNAWDLICTTCGEKHPLWDREVRWLPTMLNAWKNGGL